MRVNLGFCGEGHSKKDDRAKAWKEEHAGHVHSKEASVAGAERIRQKEVRDDIRDLMRDWIT